MYRHTLIDEHGGRHELLLKGSYYGENAFALAQDAFGEGRRYVNVNRMPYLDGRPFTGTIERHWGSVYHFRDGLLHDPGAMRPAVYEPGPNGQICFYKHGQRDDPCDGVPAFIPRNAKPVSYVRGVPRPSGAFVMNERAMASVIWPPAKELDLLVGVDLNQLVEASALVRSTPVSADDQRDSGTRPQAAARPFPRLYG